MPEEDIDALLAALIARLDALEELVDAPLNAESLGGASSEAGAPGGAEYRVVADRSHGAFLAQVDSALEAIRAGDLEKVVLALSGVALPAL